MMIRLPLALALVLSIFTRKSHACSYVTAEMKVANRFSLGTFTFALNRCQGLAVKLPPPLRLTLDGSINFKMSGSNVMAHLYTDPYCEHESQQSPKKIGTTGSSSKIQLDLFGQQSIAGGLEFVIRNYTTSTSVCAMSMAAARDCKWGQSDFYLNVSMPTGECVDTAGDFSSGTGSHVFNGEVPGNVANTVQQSSFQIDCCRDGSLLLSNYSGASCTSTPIHRDLIPSAFNGACMNLTDPSPGHRRLASVLAGARNLLQSPRFRRPPQQSSSAPNSLIFELRWECSADVALDCAAISNVNRLSANHGMPPSCSSACTRKSKTWWQKMIQRMRGRLSSTAAPPAIATIVRPGVGSGGASASDSSANGGKPKLKGIDIAAIILSCIFGVLLIGGLVYCCYMNKNRAELRGNVRSKAYAPMMEDELDVVTSNVVEVPNASGNV